MQNGSNWWKTSCHEVPSEFFATNTPEPPHWSLNSCFGLFSTIWVHLGLSGWLAKLDGKWAELVRKFVPRSSVVTFHNERTRSTPFEPKLMLWSVFSYLGAIETVWLPYKTRCKMGQSWCKSSCHDVESEFFATKAPDPPHWTLNSHFGAFRTIWVH